MRITLRLAGFALAGLATFFGGVFFTRALVRLHGEPSAWQVLLSFENQDLKGLDEKSSQVLQKAVTAITGHVRENRLSAFAPRIFRTISSTSGEKRYILVEESPLVMIPDESWLRVHVFDTEGRPLNEQKFSTGNRVVLNSIQVRKIQLINSQALVVQGKNVLGGHLLHQYYVLLGNQIVLVYLEMDGMHHSNNYNHSNLTVGPQLKRSVDEWEKALHSANDAEVLTALLWLGGHHWDGQPAPYDEDKGEAEKVSILSSREQVRKRLFELSQSKNFWIKATTQPIISKMMLAAPGP
jgi:hypothetical protein